MNWDSKWNPFGNFDDGLPSSIVERFGKVKGFIYWYFIRNPLHNFCFYWIGFKDRNLDYSHIWNQKQSWNFVLPFFSYRGKKWEFYFGWRPDTKAIGFALRRIKK